MWMGGVHVATLTESRGKMSLAYVPGNAPMCSHDRQIGGAGAFVIQDLQFTSVRADISQMMQSAAVGTPADCGRRSE